MEQMVLLRSRLRYQAKWGRGLITVALQVCICAGMLDLIPVETPLLPKIKFVRLKLGEAGTE